MHAPYQASNEQVVEAEKFRGESAILADQIQKYQDDIKLLFAKVKQFIIPRSTPKNTLHLGLMQLEPQIADLFVKLDKLCKDCDKILKSANLQHNSSAARDRDALQKKVNRAKEFLNEYKRLNDKKNAPDNQAGTLIKDESFIKRWADEIPWSQGKSSEEISWMETIGNAIQNALDEVNQNVEQSERTIIEHNPNGAIYSQLKLLQDGCGSLTLGTMIPIYVSFLFCIYKIFKKEPKA